MLWEDRCNHLSQGGAMLKLMMGGIVNSASKDECIVYVSRM